MKSTARLIENVDGDASAYNRVHETVLGRILGHEEGTEKTGSARDQVKEGMWVME